jgi:hypothetical protein
MLVDVKIVLFLPSHKVASVKDNGIHFGATYVRCLTSSFCFSLFRLFFLLQVSSSIRLHLLPLVVWDDDEDLAVDNLEFVHSYRQTLRVVDIRRTQLTHVRL